MAQKYEEAAPLDSYILSNLHKNAAVNISDFIINDVRPMLLEESIASVQDNFNQLTYSHIPVMDNTTYVGCLAETDAHCFDAEKTLADYRYALESFHVREETHWLDVIEAFAQFNTNILPVLDEQQHYLGYYVAYILQATVCIVFVTQDDLVLGELLTTDYTAVRLVSEHWKPVVVA